MGEPGVRTVNSVTNPAGLRTALRRAHGREAVAFADSAMRLVAEIEESARLADLPGRPTAKVEYLRMAQKGLAELKASCSASGLSGLKLTGVDALESRLRCLEQVFRAFGWIQDEGPGSKALLRGPYASNRGRRI